MSEEKTGIESILTILIQLEILAVSGKIVMKDGKVDMSDLPTAISLLGNIGSMIEGFAQISKTWDEAKDIDSVEAVALVQKIYEMSKSISKA